jgi:hypothetical protein
MRVTEPDLHKMALKLIEMFSRLEGADYTFDRYWRLVGAMEAFSAAAAGEVEHGMANALRKALEGRLRDAGPNSFHMDAPTVALILDAKPRPLRKGHTAAGRGKRYSR